MAIFSKKIKDLWSMVSGMKVTGSEFFKPKITIQYPREEVENLDSYRGHCELVAKKNDPYTPKCVMCGICINNCPSNCLSFCIHKENENRDPTSNIPIDKTGESLVTEGHILPNLRKQSLIEKKVTKTILKSFRLKYHYCSLCGLCVQNCPVFSLGWSNEIYLIGHKSQDFEIDLLEKLKNKAITATI